MSYGKFTTILGIDPGIADTGFGIIEKDRSGNLSCLDYGSIKTKAKLELGERLETINKEINKLIKKYKPNLVAVEQIYFCKRI